MTGEAGIAIIGVIGDIGMSGIGIARCVALEAAENRIVPTTIVAISTIIPQVLMHPTENGEEFAIMIYRRRTPTGLQGMAGSTIRRKAREIMIGIG